MITTVGLEATLETLLRDLVILDFDAAEAYEAAIKRIKYEPFQQRLDEFRQDHLRHIQELSRVLNDLGHEAPRAGDVKRLLTRGKVVMGALLGDYAILEAMRSNEEDTANAYNRAVQFETPDDVQAILKRNRADEQRHGAWLRQTVAGGNRRGSAPPQVQP
jgi:rubrerythrin